LNRHFTSKVEFSTLDKECPYLEDKQQRMHYKYIRGCSTEYSNDLVKRGYRRFGTFFSQPICDDCFDCESIRIDVNNYNLSKSQRRVVRKNMDTKFIQQEPSFSQEHIDLYNKYHKYKAEQSGWDYSEITMSSYFENFVDGHGEFGREVLFFDDDDNLIAVDLIDYIDDGISSIYFFYDPDYNKLSLGVFSLLLQIIMAKESGLEWIYLGYYVKGCKSLEYKSKYKPYQKLLHRVNDDEKYEWGL
jgi:arginyl-tRNA--protein-N-Asp/Glu arginylyltransferase